MASAAVNWKPTRSRPVPADLRIARLRFGPSDHGKLLTYDQFLHADYQPGYHYELIEGRLYVVTVPRYSHDWLEDWLFKLLEDYATRHPQIINRLLDKAAVAVPGMRKDTYPEPDLVAYRDFPRDRGPDVDWEKLSPILVIEVLSEGSIEKDLARNVGLYLKVPSIREYWVLDGVIDATRPHLKVFRRRGRNWTTIEVKFGETYTTRLLPGLEIRIDPNV